MRECGGCTMCCKTVAVKELEKPQDEWCTHCAIGEGCKVFGKAERPQSCADFNCLWKQFDLPEEFRPDKTKVVLGATTDGTRVQAFVPVDQPDAYRRGEFGAWLDGMVGSGIDVIVVIGKERKMLTSKPETIKQILGGKS